MEAREARERLERLREEFRGSLETVRERLAQPQRDSGGDIALADQHPADVATDTAERELDLSRMVSFEARLAQIDEAFARLRGGRFGVCTVCGKAIPDERLALVPDTPFCVEDATREQARTS